MRDLRLLDAYRRTDEAVVKLWGFVGDETCGAFEVPSPIDGGTLFVVASTGGGWDHVSCSRRNRIPTWGEMEHVKRLFFGDDETAMQLHVPVKDHVNCCNNALHLWRPQCVEIPRPPDWMVGPRDENQG